MSVKQKGAPVVFGIGSGSAKLIKAGSGSELSVYLQNVRLAFSSDSQESMDGNGEVVGKVFFNEKRTLTMSLFVSGATKAAAETAFESDITPGDELIVSYNEWEEVDSDTNLTGDSTAGEGKFVVDTAEKVRQAGQIAEWNITATMYANDLTANAS